MNIYSTRLVRPISYMISP